MPRLRNKVTGAVVNVSEATAARMSREWSDADAVQRSAEPDNTWKVADLRAFAEESGIELGDATKKADILEILTAGNELADEDPSVESDSSESDD